MKEKSNIISIASIILVMFYPCYFMYCVNVAEASLSSIGIISVCFIFIALIFFSIFYKFTKNIHKSATITNIMMLIFINFNIIYSFMIKILPFLSYYFLYLFCIIIISVIGTCLHYYKKNSIIISKTINKVIFIVFLSLTIMNFVISLPTIIRKLNIGNNIIKNNYEITDNFSTKENVYYFIFDEYSGKECLERYCNYQNDDFYENLKKIGFNVSETSHSEAITTNIVLANLLNLNHIVDYNTTLQAERMNYIKNPELYNLIKKNDYKLNIVDTENFLNKNQADYSYDIVINSNFANSVTHYILKNTIIYPSFLYLYDWDKNRVQNFLESINYTKQFVDNKHNGVFTLYYSGMIHGPWIVDENGNRIKNSLGNYDWSDPTKYVNQMKYVQDNILNLFKYIVEKDPNSIIIIQSDHGYRYPFHLELIFNKKMENHELENYYMTNVMNCVYYKGETLDIEGLSIHNTLKSVINKLWHADLKYEDLQTFLAPFDNKLRDGK